MNHCAFSLTGNVPEERDKLIISSRKVQTPSPQALTSQGLQIQEESGWLHSCQEAVDILEKSAKMIQYKARRQTKYLQFLYCGQEIMME